MLRLKVMTSYDVQKNGVANANFCIRIANTDEVGATLTLEQHGIAFSF